MVVGCHLDDTNLMHRVPVFIFILFFLAALDFYGYQGIKYLTRSLSSNLQTTLRILYWSLSVFVLVSVAGLFLGLIERANVVWRSLIFGAFVLNYFPKLIFFLFVVVDDLVRGVKWVVSKIQSSPSLVEPQQGEQITRSDFILKAGAVAAAVPFVATGFGIISGAHDYRIKRKRIVLPNLPKAFDGIKVAQLSDIHSGSFWNKTAVKGGVEMLMNEKPDVVFFTGDLVNDKAEEVRDYVPIFSKVKADLGVFSTFGNHDYGDYVQWSSAAAKAQNLKDLAQAHQIMGWDLLRNENRTLTIGNESIGVIGVENWGAKGNFSRYGDLSKAYQGIGEQPVKLLLSHDPSHWDAQVKNQTDIDIMFAGHTHGMQFGVEIGGFQWSPVKYMYKQWAGLYTEKNQHVYVNRGYGYIAFPGRIGIPPEISILELVRG